MQKINKFTYILTAIIAVGFFIISSLWGGGAAVVHAATSTIAYSDVLEDLMKDENFNVSDYSNLVHDNSINVIQIAESTDGQLLIYCYQPSGQAVHLRASSINIARENNDSEDLQFKNYRLSLLNSNGVFFKYKVENFEILFDSVRYYNISNILRPFNRNIDSEPIEGQFISEVPNRVAQLWVAETVEDTVKYSMVTSEVIKITQKVVGYCVYDDGTKYTWNTLQGLTKAYFVAFDTDRPIDKLISADLSFYAAIGTFDICFETQKHGHKFLDNLHDEQYIDFGTGVYNDTPLTINYTQKFSNQPIGGLLHAGHKYTFDRIRSTEDFIADNNNKDYALVSGDKLSGTKWVLNFYECQDRLKVNNAWVSFIPGLSSVKGVTDGEWQTTNVYDVQVLRLEFETEGNHYNLGVVDNKQTGNEQFNELISKPNIFLIILGVVALVLLAVLIYRLVSPIVGLVSNARLRREIRRNTNKK